MQIRFLGQGLGNGLDEQAGTRLINHLGQTVSGRFTAYVAFASESGVRALAPSLTQFCANGGHAQLFVGVDLEGTSREALHALLATPAEVYVAYTPLSIIYHPKVYVLEGPQGGAVVVGSSNLTTTGLFQNIEGSLLVEFGPDDPDGTALVQQIYGFFASLSGNIRQLDAALITLLEQAGLVPTEASRRARQNKVAPGSIPVGAQAGLQGTLHSLFPPRHILAPPPPSGGGHTSGPGAGAPIPPQPAPLPIPSGPSPAPGASGFPGAGSGAFWIETGSLTGGSHNQLDLSVRGQQSATGTSQLFGVQANSTTSRSITLRYDGVDYSGNTIKWMPNNGMWRLMMNGTSSNGEKLTPISEQWFRSSILTFRPLGPNHYEVTRVDATLLQQVINASSSSDRNPNAGRHFGTF
jgi:HKD family nuclease